MGFFVVKDGWLLYYSETERKDFAKKPFFNTRPKCAIPLGVCRIMPSREPGQPFAIVISGEEMEGKLTLAAESEFERDRWLDTLEKTKRITWANQQLSDSLIQQLENHGLTMAKQKQDYFDRLQSEVLELADEKEKTWELERLNEELEKEKAKMETFAAEMREDVENVKRELEETQGYMKELDTERTELSAQLDSQEDNLQILAKEKEGILHSLKQQETVTELLSQEKETLSQTKQEFTEKLLCIEQQTDSLLQEKAEAENRLRENEERAMELEEEKQMYNEQALDLQDTIKDLTIQKEMTEAELKEEVLARMTAEKRLSQAEQSLQKLGQAVEHETPNIQDNIKEEMVVNVNKLRGFFENLAEEAKVDPDKPVVIKNAIHARKTIMRRNKAKRFERRKSSSMRAKSMNVDQLLLRDKKFGNPRRTQSTVIKSPTQKEPQERILRLPDLTEEFSEQM